MRRHLCVKKLTLKTVKEKLAKTMDTGRPLLRQLQISRGESSELRQWS